MKSKQGTNSAASESPGHTMPMGHDRSEPTIKAGKLTQTANLKGHGHIWNLAVVFHPIPNK